jgi:hypothetical protein
MNLTLLQPPTSSARLKRSPVAEDLWRVVVMAAVIYTQIFAALINT